MTIIKCYMTQNPCYKNNVSKVDSRYTTFQSRGPRGLMLHSVGCAQPDASVFISGWNKPTYTNSCVHGIIDANSGDVFQTLPWNYRGWHGGGSDLFIVTITVTDGRPSTISADHTLAEINAAYNDRKVVVGKVVLHNKVAEYVAGNRSVAETKVIFPRAAFFVDNLVYFTNYVIDANGISKTEASISIAQYGRETMADNEH